MKKEFDLQLQESRQEITKLSDLVKQQEQAFRSALDEQAQKFQAKLDDLQVNLKEMQQTHSTTVEKVKASVEEQGKVLGDKVSNLQEGLHKQEVQGMLSFILFFKKGVDFGNKYL